MESTLTCFEGCALAFLALSPLIAFIVADILSPERLRGGHRPEDSTIGRDLNALEGLE